MSSIIASHIPTTISNEKLQEFFGFCGKIKSINLLDKDDKFQKYQITFESPKALSTAVLLNDAELDGVPIIVEEEPKGIVEQPQALHEDPPSYEATEKSAIEDHKIQSNATLTGDDNYDDITQEEKPKSAILAQLLSQGYNLSDQLIEKSIKFDNEKGYTTKFKSFLNNLDSKYLHLQEPESSASKNLNSISNKFNSLASSFQGSKYQQKLSHYYEKASSHPYGVKVHDFYKNLHKDVIDVHNEAKRLNELKKNNLESEQATANAAAAINTAN